MLASWHTFFYDAFDPAGFITIDKPPLAFWIQAASAWVFGYRPPSLLLPQVVEGLLSVGIVFVVVQRRFGDAAALLAALFLALMPITVAVDRSNNTESCLTLLLLLSAWTFVVASECASLSRLCLSAVLLGLAFNTKFLAAFVLVPIYIALYLKFAPRSIAMRCKHLVAAAAVLAIVSLSWITVFDLTKPGDRPYAAKTRGNSMWELAFSTYGAKILPGASVATADVAVVPAPRPSGGRRSAFYDDVPVGPLRLADPHLAAQFSWLFPIALAGVLVLLVRERKSPEMAKGQISLWLWLAWILAYATAFSFDGGSFHAYYLALLAPPLAMLVGVTLSYLGVMARYANAWRWPTSLVLLGTAAWQTYIQASSIVLQQPFSGALGVLKAALMPGNYTWPFALMVVMLAVTLICAVILALARRKRTHAFAMTGAVAALLVLPTTWALSNVLARGNVMIPAAEIGLLTGQLRDPRTLYSSGYGVATEDPKLIAFLQAEQRGERFILATPNARLAAPIIVRSGKAVMAMGGFSGLDPAIDADTISRMVREGQLRFVLLGRQGSYGNSEFAEGRRRAIVALAREQGARVDPALWRTEIPEGGVLQQRRQGDRMGLWDLQARLPDLKSDERE
jgi:4-amino-4-deoxy-L-arabinose transferase-like glycosyltransferase